ncbi:MAG TPA: hypothetical protein VLT61_07760 [Anaeromyxobacteraceae bacterium]|nr:hypothetical protein [Anaeromyxobacteraceae bacterium]
MKRPEIARALAFAALVSAGCPIPQTVPEYPKGTSITPPRIVAETAVPDAGSAVIRVPTGCTPKPSLELSASLVDENTDETVEARWFVDYVGADPSRDISYQTDRIEGIHQPDPNRPITTRAIPPYPFSPYSFGAAAGTVHVVELVVSNGFDPAADTVPVGGVPALPNRTPLPSFETQVYRWVIMLTDDPCPP